jgi:hypothetical protein
MTKKQGFISVLLCISFAVFPVSRVAATDIPQYTSCTNPQGAVVANYSSGVHGIVGSMAEHTGSDTVYSLPSGAFTQCFCDNNGHGVQTDWLNATGFTDAEIQIFKNEGWYYIPDGSLWGLSGAPYLARNTAYTCNGDTGGGTGGGGSNNGGGGSSTSGGTSGGIGGAEVLSATTILPEILGDTGNILEIYILFGLGAATFLTGVYLTLSSGKKHRA